MELSRKFRQAADLLREAQAFIIASGAGMGVDSGLPDFRGDSGFWQAYPLYERLGINFVDAANPEHFERDPSFGWGFYGHRSNLYRETSRTTGSGCCLTGSSVSAWRPSWRPPTWMASFRKQVSIRKASWSSTAPFTICSAAGRVPD